MAIIEYVEYNIKFVYGAIRMLERTEKSGQIDRQTDTSTKNNTLPQGLRSVTSINICSITAHPILVVDTFSHER